MMEGTCLWFYNNLKIQWYVSRELKRNLKYFFNSWKKNNLLKIINRIVFFFFFCFSPIGSFYNQFVRSYNRLSVPLVVRRRATLSYFWVRSSTLFDSEFPKSTFFWHIKKFKKTTYNLKMVKTHYNPLT